MKALALAAALAALPLLSSTAAAEPAQAMTRGLNHLGLTVSKLDASVQFFTDTLGWRVAGGDRDYPAVYVTDGQLFLTLWQATEPAAPFNRKTNVGLHHLALTVDSFEALDVLHRRFLKAPGVVIEFGPELNGGGPTKHMMIREPSGNRLEFAHNPPRR